MKRRRFLTFISAAFLSALCGWGAGKFARLLVTESESPSAVPSVSAAPPASAFDKLRGSPAAAGRALAEKGEMDKTFAKKWAAKDPRSLYAWLLKGRPQPSKEVLAVFFKEWALRDPDAAFEAARNLPPRFERGEFYPEMLNALMVQDIDAVIRWAGRVQGEINSLAWPSTDWIKEPPERLAERLKSVSPGLYTGMVVKSFAHYWATLDFDAARGWAQSLDPELRGRAMEAVLEFWAVNNLPEALEYLKTEAKSQERQSGAFQVILALGGENPAEAIGWMTEHLGGSDGNVLNNLMGRWAREDVVAATAYVEGIENQQLRLKAVESLAQSWNWDEFKPESVEWMKGLPAREERAAALQNLSSAWAHGDAKGFREYLAGLPGEEVTNTIQAKSAYWLSGENAAESFRWSAGLTNGAAERAVSAIVARWRENAPQAAADAVEALPPGPAREAGPKALRPAADPFIR